MGKNLRKTAVGVALVLCGGALWAATCAAGDVESAAITDPPLRQWTARDSAQVRYFSTDRGDFWGGGSNVAVSSPGGTSFFFVSHHGDLTCDCNVYELSVFRVRDVVRALDEGARSPPAPWRTLKMGHKYKAIDRARWEGEASIVFLGRRDPQSSGQVYRLDLINGELKALTNAPAQRGPFGITLFGKQGAGVVAFSQEVKPKAPPYPYYALTPDRASEMLSTYLRNEHYVYRAYVSYQGRPTWEIRAVSMGTGGPWLSPDGRRAIVARVPAPVPEGWSAYDGVKILKPEDPEMIAPSTFFQFALVDLEQRTERPLFDAPMGDATRVGAGAEMPRQVLWSEDGQQVVLVNTALPVGSQPQATQMAYMVSYDLRTSRWDVLEPLQQPSGLRIKDVTWLQPGREFLVRHQQGDRPAQGTVYALRGGQWQARTVTAAMEPRVSKPPALAQGLKVKLRQSANDPPEVVASRRGRELPLVGSDPALAGLWMAQTQLFTWRDSDGVTRTSTLLLPQHVPSDGSKVPLVIQATILYPPDLDLAEFHPDGTSSTAYADQALVAQGMVVLNLDATNKITELVGTYRETEVFADWVASVTQALAREYPVDPARVGLVGFSRMGYQTRYLITHSGRLRPAAAVIADSATGSYLLAMIQQATGYQAAFERSYNRTYGGSFFESKSSWLEREVSFNVDKVQTPVLFVENGDNLAYRVDTVGAFKANHKPFEFLFLGDTDHQLLLPRVREASLEATVDWMRFWLKNEEDARPDKADRYARWRVQRELQKAETVRPPASISAR